MMRSDHLLRLFHVALNGNRKKSTNFGRTADDLATPPSIPAAQWLGRPRWDNEVERVLWLVAATRRRRSFWNSTRCILLSHLDSRSGAGFKRSAKGPTHTGIMRRSRRSPAFRGPLNDIFSNLRRFITLILHAY